MVQLGQWYSEMYRKINKGGRELQLLLILTGTEQGVPLRGEIMSSGPPWLIWERDVIQLGGLSCDAMCAELSLDLLKLHLQI